MLMFPFILVLSSNLEHTDQMDQIYLLLSNTRRNLSFFNEHNMSKTLPLEFLLIFLEMQLPGNTNEVAIPLE